MENISQALALLNLHVSAALDLQEQANEAKFHTQLSLFDEIVRQAEEWQGISMQRSIDLLDRGVSDEDYEDMPKIVSSASSYLDPYPRDLAGAEAHRQAVRWALATFVMKTREAIVLTNTHTADVFTEVSRAADQTLRNM
jgi:hypothetical protein